jgi:hypothetical protein
MIPVFRQFKRYARFRGRRPIPELQPCREGIIAHRRRDQSPHRAIAASKGSCDRRTKDEAGLAREARSSKGRIVDSRPLTPLDTYLLLVMR